MPERATLVKRSEKSAEAIIAVGEYPAAKGRTERRAKGTMRLKGTRPGDVRATGATAGV
jgi:hypothetical protein